MTPDKQAVGKEKVAKTRRRRTSSQPKEAREKEEEEEEDEEVSLQNDTFDMELEEPVRKRRRRLALRADSTSHTDGDSLEQETPTRPPVPVPPVASAAVAEPVGVDVGTRPLSDLSSSAFPLAAPLLTAPLGQGAVTPLPAALGLMDWSTSATSQPLLPLSALPLSLSTAEAQRLLLQIHASQQAVVRQTRNALEQLQVQQIVASIPRDASLSDQSVPPLLEEASVATSSWRKKSITAKAKSRRASRPVLSDEDKQRLRMTAEQTQKWQKNHTLEFDDLTEEQRRYCFCPVCKTTFSAKKSNHFKDHMATHSGKSGIKCIGCDQIIARSQNVFRHERTVHGVDRLHRCPDCGQASLRFSRFKMHMNQTHGVEPDCAETEEHEKYRCTEPNCSVVLLSYDEFKDHADLMHGRQRKRAKQGASTGSERADGATEAKDDSEAQLRQQVLSTPYSFVPSLSRLVHSAFCGIGVTVCVCVYICVCVCVC
ncbi:MAG: hypothetical protein MHM6MM_007349, partial [Cercozoa sp. M6MM]